MKGSNLRIKLAGIADDADFTATLRAAALRVTRPRLAVLRADEDHPHADTESIIRAARERLPEVSHQTVYDALNALTAAGPVRRIQPAGSVARYESRVGENHHVVSRARCRRRRRLRCRRNLPA